MLVIHPPCFLTWTFTIKETKSFTVSTSHDAVSGLENNVDVNFFSALIFYVLTFVEIEQNLPCIHYKYCDFKEVVSSPR